MITALLLALSVTASAGNNSLCFRANSEPYLCDSSTPPSDAYAMTTSSYNSVIGYAPTFTSSVTVASNLSVSGTMTSSTFTLTGTLTYKSLTKLQLTNTTPGSVGMSFYCSDCTPKKVVVSTGTSIKNFADMAGGEFK